jgi:beta-galactosidase
MNGCHTVAGMLRRSRLLGLLAAAVCCTAGTSNADVYQTPSTPRLEQTINRDWTFNYFPSENADTNGCAAVNFDDSTWPAIALPHTWLTYETTGKLHPFIHDAHEKDNPYWWRGWGWYRKHFSISPEAAGRRIYVEFDAVQKYCKVFVNGRWVGDHKGGYDGFYFDITDLVRFGADNVLAVAVNCDQDDRFQIPPMSAGNWNTYGGIYRDVRLVLKDPLHIPFQGSYRHEGGTFVTTPRVSEAAGTVEVKTWLRNDYATSKECELRTTIADADNQVLQVLTARKILPPGALAEFDQISAPVPHPHLWSPETPYVYHVFSDVYSGGTAVDHFESPLGFRWFKWDYTNNRLILNGKKVIIHGTNHHQEWPWLGDATPKWLLLADLRDIRENLNDNFMRTAHYPNDPAVYDFNDHHGIITIEELPNDKRQKFSTEVQVQQLRETIRRDRNHPSIFFWSMGNETDDAVDSRYAVAEDTTRLIHARDIYDHYQSAGKYLNTTSSNLALESLLRCTIRGWYNSDVRDLEPKSVQQAGNEEWQHDQAAAAFIKLNRGRAADDLANLNTWIYEDHGCDRRYLHCPLVFVNPKGWVDLWREPKYMYYLWQAWYSPRPMVYIHPYVWSRRYLGQKKEVVVDSNCQSVELFVNGRRMGVLHPSLEQANVLRFENVPIETGVLMAVGKAQNQTVTNQVVMAGPPARLTVRGFVEGQSDGLTGGDLSEPSSAAEPLRLPAARDALAVVRADIVDANGVHVFGATNTLYWSVSGPATLVGAPVYQSDIARSEATEGTMYIDTPALNLIRSTGQSGVILVRVQSPGLRPAEISILATNVPQTGSWAIMEPPLPTGNRQPVARENIAAPPRETVAQQMHGVPDDLVFKTAALEDYARVVDDFLREKNPDLDFNTPEYRTVVSVFARLARDNHGRIVRDDFNFIVDGYNNCRQITQQIDALPLPDLFKQSLHRHYVQAMIEQGEAKDCEAEIRRLKSLPPGRVIVAAAPDMTAGSSDTNVLYANSTNFADLVALALPEFKHWSSDRQAAALAIIAALNPGVHPRVTGRAETDNRLPPGAGSITYQVSHGQAVLVPTRDYLIAALQLKVKQAQN